jgi:hypothetical protein
MPTDVRPKPYKPGKHASQTGGHGIGVPKDPSPNMPKGGGAGKHESQPQGHGIGVPTRSNTVKNMGIHGPDSGGGIFKTRGAVLRNSGVKGAYRIGSKKK